MVLDVVLIEDMKRNITVLMNLLQARSGDGIRFKPIHKVNNDPREALKMVSQCLWPKNPATAIRPFCVILDLNFSFDVGDHASRWIYGLKIVYQGMIEEWRQHQGSRPWQHIYVRSRLQTHATDDTQDALEKEMQRYHIPYEDHFFRVPSDACDQHDSDLVEKLAKLAQQDRATTDAGGVCVCECLKEMNQYP